MEDPQMLATPTPPVHDYPTSNYGDYMSVSNPATTSSESATHFTATDLTMAQNSAPSDGAVDPSVSQSGLTSGTDLTREGRHESSFANGNESKEETGMIEQRFGAETGASTEEDRLWSIVRTNSLDFNAWTALILEAEKENNIQKLRGVYDAFLAEFPLCYGYWKKYADHEARLCGAEKVVEVYERAVLAVTYSVDIWLHYCEFAIPTYEDPDTIRRLFERGLAYVGTDYLSSPLWDEYIKYEYSRQAWSNVAMIYTRILENPIQHFDRYINSFKELALSRPLSEIRTSDEAELLTITAAPKEEVEGEFHPDSVEQSTKNVTASLTDAEVEKYIAIRDDMYKKAKEFESKIIGFETAIRRPYFHVRPLDDPELENWHSYLDFIERGDDFNKVVKLYERCLIACANYPEFWIRYILCMEASGSLELANNALARATQVFVKKRPEIHIFAARFKENHEDIPGARAEFQLLHSEISPGYLEAVVKHANMEYRLGNREAAFSIYEEAIAAERGKELSQVLPMLLVQYSRFQFLVIGDAEKAREILSGSFEQVQLSRPLVEAIIHLESLLPRPKRIDYVDSLVEKFITPNPENPNCPSTADREDASSICLEFLDLFGDAQSIKKADTRHCSLFLRHRSSSISRKRHAEDYMDSERVKLLKTYGHSSAGAYTSSQTQWASGYGPTKPSSWATTATAQTQPWNPAYGAQGAYAGYGSYPGYGQPQAASSYPPSYPATSYQQAAAAVAAYGQQPTTAAAAVAAYGQQPTTAAAAVAAYGQQPTVAATATSAYYGAYY